MEQGFAALLPLMPSAQGGHSVFLKHFGVNVSNSALLTHTSSILPGCWQTPKALRCPFPSHLQGVSEEPSPAATPAAPGPCQQQEGEEKPFEETAPAKSGGSIQARCCWEKGAPLWGARLPSQASTCPRASPPAPAPAAAAGPAARPGACQGCQRGPKCSLSPQPP